MKISLNWIEDYVTPGIRPDELVHKLTMAGLEVEKTVSKNNDHVFELEITPNRPDCLSMIGMAREISAILNKPLKTPNILKTTHVTKKCDVSIEDSEGCQRYVGVLIEGVDVKASDSDISKKLEAIELRSVNNIVDITNFSMMENGQPLHAFDFDKLEGGKVIVRRAKKGESITTIDGVKRDLDSSILVIADAKKPVAIAGVMGGLDTEVKSSTKNVLLESAYFNSILIRRTARKLGLSSDSSYRFERGLDYDGVTVGSQRAEQLILSHGGGFVKSRADVKAGKVVKKSKSVQITVEAVNNYLGTKVTKAQMKTGLKKLGFVVTDKTNGVHVAPPSFRHDINRDVDIIEEVARIIGFDNIPTSLPVVSAINIPSQSRRYKRKELAKSMVGQGFCEVVTFAMYSEESFNKAMLAGKEVVRVLNPLTKEQEIMRPSLLPSLLSVAQSNINHGQKNLQVFETGKVYQQKEEREVLAILLTGQAGADWRQDKIRKIDFYDTKGALDIGLRTFEGVGVNYSVSENISFEEGQRANISINGKVLGSIGKVDDTVTKAFGIKKQEIYYAEVDLEGLVNVDMVSKRYSAIAEYPAVTRDVSLAVSKDISFKVIKDIINRLGSNILNEVNFVEEYLGEKIAQDQRGLVFSLTYQSFKRTLTEDEVNVVHDSIITAICSEVSAVIR
ncbi:MAG: phenylalanyl-tRNA synthetase beta chain [Candidatus Omnitrophota bacterium]|jgi:phenylalanyl-tRNA synthetase beta chain